MRRALLLLTVLLAAGAVPASAQERVDSARLRVFQRLERLGRAPGADSALFVRDSLRQDSLRNTPRGGGGAGADSVVAALLRLPGYTLTEYDGGEARFGAVQRELVLQAAEGGRARVNREGMEVQADSSILYNEETGRVRTRGSSTFRPPQGDPVESAGLVYDLQGGRGSAVAARTSYAQGSARWNVTGDMPFANSDSTFMSHARFTSCDLEVPHYHFETDEIKIVGNSVLVARPVRLYFADVPVAWLPFIAQSLSQGRSSGLLTPRFSVNDIVRTSGGYNRRISNVGFYWAMSDYSDAIMAFDWFSENFFSMTASTAYRWNRQFLDGNVNFRRYWRADGSTELALNTRHAWEMDERTQFRMSGSYISNSDFLEANSTNPLEVIQSIDSEGGINRRFGWGSLSLQANRKQYLSDDRVEWTLPSLNLSLSTITLFRAPPNRSSFYNNMTWSGSGSFRRSTVDRVQAPVFDPSLVSTGNTTGSLSSNVSLGNLTFSQGVDIREESEFGIPEAILMPGEDGAPDQIFVNEAMLRDVTRTNLSWRTSLGYQQQLIGSTTITPRLSLTGSQLKSDTSALAQSFVSAPSRLSFGATLKTDIYGFLRGGIPERFGFEAIRHKFSPSFEYTYSPEVRPDSLQRKVFGSRVLQPQNAISITLNQTWEAKRLQPEDSSAAGAGGAAGGEQPQGPAADGGPRRVERAPVLNLLALRTSVVRYDFVEADSAGSFISGFETTRLSNQISSDFLRGLTLSVEHDLFEETPVQGGGAGARPSRSFAPHLASLNLSFSLNNRSGIFRFLGLAGDADPAAEEEEADSTGLDPADPFAEQGATDESSMVPRGGVRQAPRERSGSRSGWNASLSYALTRPRDPTLESSQMLNGTITLRPTEHWDLSWRTSYDIERSRFNDHSIRLSRDLHRWKANFDFLQTATGNWTFRFEVSLIDNSDLKFDYEQRNLDVGLPPSQRRR